MEPYWSDDTIGLSVYHADLNDVLPQIRQDSTALIFTDPPYFESFVPLYGQIAKHGSQILVEGGSMLAYAPHYALPRILNEVGDSLRYWWLCGCRHAGGGNARLIGKCVFVHYKPIPWWVKHKRRDMKFVADMVDNALPEKGFHKWQQGESVADYYIGRLTNPGELVIDPCCGGGTTIAVCARLGRRCITMDTSEESCDKTVARLTGGFSKFEPDHLFSPKGE